MNADPTASDDRARRAARIIQNPGRFKVCEGCDSIVAARAATCPNCEAYRFEHDPQAVAAQASLLAGREPQSVTAEDLYS